MFAPHQRLLDARSDLDLIVGDSSGRLHYFEREASGALVRREGASNPFAVVNMGGRSAALEGAFRTWLDRLLERCGDLCVALPHLPEGARQMRTAKDR